MRVHIHTYIYDSFEISYRLGCVGGVLGYVGVCGVGGGGWGCVKERGKIKGKW